MGHSPSQPCEVGIIISPTSQMENRGLERLRGYLPKVSQWWSWDQNEGPLTPILDLWNMGRT